MASSMQRPVSRFKLGIAFCSVAMMIGLADSAFTTQPPGTMLSNLDIICEQPSRMNTSNVTTSSTARQKLQDYCIGRNFSVILRGPAVAEISTATGGATSSPYRLKIAVENWGERPIVARDILDNTLQSFNPVASNDSGTRMLTIRIPETDLPQGLNCTMAFVHVVLYQGTANVSNVGSNEVFRPDFPLPGARESMTKVLRVGGSSACRQGGFPASDLALTRQENNDFKNLDFWMDLLANLIPSASDDGSSQFAFDSSMSANSSRRKRSPDQNRQQQGPFQGSVTGSPMPPTGTPRPGATGSTGSPPPTRPTDGGAASRLSMSGGPIGSSPTRSPNGAGSSGSPPTRPSMGASPTGSPPTRSPFGGPGGSGQFNQQAPLPGGSRGSNVQGFADTRSQQQGSRVSAAGGSLSTNSPRGAMSSGSPPTGSPPTRPPRDGMSSGTGSPPTGSPRDVRDSSRTPPTGSPRDGRDPSGTPPTGTPRGGMSSNGTPPPRQPQGGSSGQRGGISGTQGFSGGGGGQPGGKPPQQNSNGGAFPTRPPMNGNSSGSPPTRSPRDANFTGSPPTESQREGNFAGSPPTSPPMNGSFSGSPPTRPPMNGNSTGFPPPRDGSGGMPGKMSNGSNQTRPDAQGSFPGQQGGQRGPPPEGRGAQNFAGQGGRPLPQNSNGGAPPTRPPMGGNFSGSPPTRSPRDANFTGSLPTGSSMRNGNFTGFPPPRPPMSGNFTGSLSPWPPMSGNFTGSLPPRPPMNGNFTGSPPPWPPMSGNSTGSPPPWPPMSGNFTGSLPPRPPMSGNFTGSPPPWLPMSGNFTGSLPLRPPMNGNFSGSSQGRNSSGPPPPIRGPGGMPNSSNQTGRPGQQGSFPGQPGGQRGPPGKGTQNFAGAGIQDGQQAPRSGSTPAGGSSSGTRPSSRPGSFSGSSPRPTPPFGSSPATPRPGSASGASTRATPAGSSAVRTPPPGANSGTGPPSASGGSGTGSRLSPSKPKTGGDGGAAPGGAAKGFGGNLGGLQQQIVSTVNRLMPGALSSAQNSFNTFDLGQGGSGFPSAFNPMSGSDFGSAGGDTSGTPSFVDRSVINEIKAEVQGAGLPVFLNAEELFTSRKLNLTLRNVNGSGTQIGPAFGRVYLRSLANAKTVQSFLASRNDELRFPNNAGGKSRWLQFSDGDILLETNLTKILGTNNIDGLTSRPLNLSGVQLPPDVCGPLLLIIDISTMSDSNVTNNRIDVPFYLECFTDGPVFPRPAGDCKPMVGAALPDTSAPPKLYVRSGGSANGNLVRIRFDPELGETGFEPVPEGDREIETTLIYDSMVKSIVPFLMDNGLCKPRKDEPNVVYFAAASSRYLEALNKTLTDLLPSLSASVASRIRDESASSVAWKRFMDMAQDRRCPEWLRAFDKIMQTFIKGTIETMRGMDMGPGSQQPPNNGYLNPGGPQPGPPSQQQDPDAYKQVMIDVLQSLATSYPNNDSVCVLSAAERGAFLDMASLISSGGSPLAFDAYFGTMMGLNSYVERPSASGFKRADATAMLSEQLPGLIINGSMDSSNPDYVAITKAINSTTSTMPDAVLYCRDLFWWSRFDWKFIAYGQRNNMSNGTSGNETDAQMCYQKAQAVVQVSQSSKSRPFRSRMLWKEENGLIYAGSYSILMSDIFWIPVYACSCGGGGGGSCGMASASSCGGRGRGDGRISPDWMNQAGGMGRDFMNGINGGMLQQSAQLMQSLQTMVPMLSSLVNILRSQAGSNLGGAASGDLQSRLAQLGPLLNQMQSQLPNMGPLINNMPPNFPIYNGYDPNSFGAPSTPSPWQQAMNSLNNMYSASGSSPTYNGYNPNSYGVPTLPPQLQQAFNTYGASSLSSYPNLQQVMDNLPSTAGGTVTQQQLQQVQQAMQQAMNSMNLNNFPTSAGSSATQQQLQQQAQQAMQQAMNSMNLNNLPTSAGSFAAQQQLQQQAQQAMQQAMNSMNLNNLPTSAGSSATQQQLQQQAQQAMQQAMNSMNLNNIPIPTFSGTPTQQQAQQAMQQAMNNYNALGLGSMPISGSAYSQQDISNALSSMGISSGSSFPSSSTYQQTAQQAANALNNMGSFPVSNSQAMQAAQDALRNMQSSMGNSYSDPVQAQAQVASNMQSILNSMLG